jgi:hypothetical protein
VTGRRAAWDLAQPMRWQADEAYPQAELTPAVSDSLDTHPPTSL